MLAIPCVFDCGSDGWSGVKFWDKLSTAISSSCVMPMTLLSDESTVSLFEGKDVETCFTGLKKQKREVVNYQHYFTMAADFKCCLH